MDLDLTYHVPGASWSPAYAIRAEADRSAATIDCDALVVQRTGEDWRDAWISLSTATPDRSAEPGEVEPVFVDVARAPRPVPGRRMAKGLSAPAEAGAPVDAEAGTAIRATGVAVTYDLPRRLTVPSDADRRQRARIATVEPAARFTWVAEPIAGDAVYLRGDFVNSSRLQFLPGEAEVHMGGEYLGRTGMPSVAPGSSFEVFFGPDRALRATREVVSRVTGDAGLFGGPHPLLFPSRYPPAKEVGRRKTDQQSRCPVRRIWKEASCPEDAPIDPRSRSAREECGLPLEAWSEGSFQQLLPRQGDRRRRLSQQQQRVHLAPSGRSPAT